MTAISTAITNVILGDLIAPDPVNDAQMTVDQQMILMIKETMAAQPRSLQTAIGPSEIGIACTRTLIHKISGHSEKRSRPAWKAFIGSCVHSGLERGLTAWRLNQGAQPRFLVESEVTVGTAGGHDIVGHADVFDIDSGTVIDWKVVGASQLMKYRSKGPSQQYRIQAHLYGRGFALAGYVVHDVMDIFLPREGELHNTFVWSEPYDESVAVKALSRLNGLYELSAAIGPAALLDLYPPCNDFWCAWCSRR